MAGKVAPTAQWTERAEIAVRARAGHITLQPNGRYLMFSATGEDDARLVEQDDGRHEPVVGAAEGERVRSFVSRVILD